jgi:tetratricopeptide (TPR) repeat protein/predicted aspartyl protease
MSSTRPIVAGTINGQEAHFLADSGAFFSSLTVLAAERFGLKPKKIGNGYFVRGVGGTSIAELAKVQDFGLKGLPGTAHGVDFLVIGKLYLGEADGMIGQNIFGVGDTEFDLANGVIRVVRVKDCANRRLDYWNHTAEFGLIDIQSSTPQHSHIVGTAVLDGLKIRVLFDTGASTSLLSRRVAEKVGIKPDSPGVIPAGFTGGIGERRVDTWIGTFKSLDLGGETIRNIKIRFGASAPVEDEDLTLGADFFLSHRIYVAKSQNKLYFSYNGGPVFDLKVRTEATPSTSGTGDASTPSEPGANPAPEAGDVARTDYSDTPKDAAGFRRRGAASEARGDLAGALSDFDRAIALDPHDPDGYHQRALLRLRTHAEVSAMQDLDQALLLRPDANLFLLRGELRLTNNNPDGAEADFNAATALATADQTLTLKVANAEINAGRFDEAIVRLDHWVATHPVDPILTAALNARCWARASQGAELKLALADCDYAVRAAPRAAPFLNSRALVHLKLGNLDRAIKDYKAALAANPKMASSLYGLGLAEMKKGLKNDADRDLQAALQLSPAIAEQYKRIGLAP